MRFVHIGLITLLCLLLVVFALQNFSQVTVQLFAFSVTMPLSIVVVLVFVLGVYTGGTVRSMVRKLVKGASRPKAP